MAGLARTHAQASAGPSVASLAILNRAHRLTVRFRARIPALPLENDQCAPFPPGHGRPQPSAAAAAGGKRADRGHSGLLPGCQHAWVHAASASTDAEQLILLVCETLTGIDVSRVPELLQT